MEFSKTYNFLGKELKLSTGKLARLAQGSVLLQVGGTSLLAATSLDRKDAEQDFFPLSVEYIEKMYARGAISGSRFAKREGFPSDEAIIKARQVDHSIRSLFPKSFRKPTGVVLTVLSYDQENDPETLAVLGASLSLMLTGMPFYGPSSSVIACVTEDNQILINPHVENREDFKAEFLLSGIDGKLLNIEGWGKQVEEELMDKILDEAMSKIIELNAIQKDFVKSLPEELAKHMEGKFDEEYNDFPAPEEFIHKIDEAHHAELEEILYQPERDDRMAKIDALNTKLIEQYVVEGSELKAIDVTNAVDYVSKKIIRKNILENNKRRLNRGLEEIRPLSAEIDILPTVHGSALFTRGMTQSLSIVTLGAQSYEQLIDDMEGESAKRFMHHYNMPPFSTGEAGRYSYKPGRREIGHGAIGENALKNMIPSDTEFPYTIRVVSEILSSNGSTSMAATCASSMALMAAGVPLKEAVAGIGVGLITRDGNEDDYKLLLDIEGIEDFYGDMDFKVTGTKNGITAIQFENKLRGVKIEVLKKAFRLAQTGRMQVLQVMNSAISESRSKLADSAPVVGTIKIAQDKIGMLIGPGGKNIKDLTARSEAYGKSSADINISDDGSVLITASNAKQLEFVKNEIDSMLGEPEVGKIYKAKVDRVMPYGIFVNVSSNISGLCHVSEIFDKRGEYNLDNIFKKDDELKVTITKIDGDRLNFSIKGLEQDAEIAKKIQEAQSK